MAKSPAKAAPARVTNLAEHSIKALGLSHDVEQALEAIQAELAEAYRESFVEMVRALNKQASALDRIQTTLHVLVSQLPASVKGNLPPAIRVAGDDEQADLASAVIVADPIGAGYTMSQASVAQALNLKQADVSVLLKAFKIDEDGQCAVIIRQGSKYQRLVNYHPRTLQRFRECVARLPAAFKPDLGQQKALERVRATLITSPRAGSEGD